MNFQLWSTAWPAGVAAASGGTPGGTKSGNLGVMMPGTGGVTVAHAAVTSASVRRRALRIDKVYLCSTAPAAPGAGGERRRRWRRGRRGFHGRGRGRGDTR